MGSAGEAEPLAGRFRRQGQAAQGEMAFYQRAARVMGLGPDGAPGV